MKFDLTDQDLQVISEPLSAAPFGRVAAVVQTLQRQINDQLTQHPKPPILKPKKE